MPASSRVIDGDLIALQAEGTGDRLFIAGGGSSPDRLSFIGGGDDPTLAGTSEVAPRAWHHVALVCDGETVSVYLDGRPEIEGRSSPLPRRGPTRLRIGGGGDEEACFEGKLDEVAVYDRCLTPAEIASHLRAARTGP